LSFSLSHTSSNSCTTSLLHPAVEGWSWLLISRNQIARGVAIVRREIKNIQRSSGAALDVLKEALLDSHIKIEV
jgi:hypothetical protein